MFLLMFLRHFYGHHQQMNWDLVDHTVTDPKPEEPSRRMYSDLHHSTDPKISPTKSGIKLSNLCSFPKGIQSSCKESRIQRMENPPYPSLKYSEGKFPSLLGIPTSFPTFNPNFARWFFFKCVRPTWNIPVKSMGTGLLASVGIRRSSQKCLHQCKLINSNDITPDLPE